MKSFEEFLLEKRISNTKLDSIQIGSEYEGGLYVGVVDGKELVVNTTLIPSNKYASTQQIIKRFGPEMNWRLPTFDEYKVIFGVIKTFPKMSWYWTSNVNGKRTDVIYGSNSLQGKDSISGTAHHNALMVRNP